FVLVAVFLLLIPFMSLGQAPNLGTAADFVLFSSVGAVTNSGTSLITGNVGANSGSITGFGNVNGVMHANDGASAQCAADLLIAYNQLNSAIPTFFPAPLLGNGQILIAGVYSVSGPATLDLELTLDAEGDSTSVFIIQIQGAFSTNANSIITLINGALACNVFWKVEGLVSMATGTTMRGTVVANNAAIDMYTGVTLEGRALSTTGAVSVSGVLAYTPIGCGSPILTGPAPPPLASTICYALFSANGEVTNAGITYVTGDVGTNVGLTTGFDPLLVNGTIHPIPDVSTAQCAADLINVRDYLIILPYDIELLYPAQFGNNLVLTPHTYLLNAATVFTDTLYLNALGNSDAVFVIKIYGALTTSTYSKVILTNGTQPKNVFWLVNGAVSIADYSIFKGTIVCNNGAIDLATGVMLDGRALTTVGFLSTAAITAIMPPGCPIPGIVLNIKAFLEGPFVTDQMIPFLNTLGNLPLAQPYSNAPWNYSGAEFVSSIPDPDIVDWVLVELRDASSAASAGNATMIDRQAAFIHSDGTITNIDGSGMLTFLTTYSQDLFVVLWHRNHLGIMSAVPLTESGGVYSYDFTSSATSVYGGILAHKEVATGIWGMTGGDGDSNGEVNNVDKNDVWNAQAGLAGYLAGDFNMDIEVNNGDKNDIWLPNAGKGGQVPDLYAAKCYIPE
ncbi:MAG: DUF3494 domain-containing protein, partial [Bacteroidales bacterium]|nr:DUF3494 domain-containing protein [Bacteroidales bacterium]